MELTTSESHALLAFAMWDNRCTLHRVASDLEGEHMMEGATVAGLPPIGPARVRCVPEEIG